MGICGQGMALWPCREAHEESRGASLQGLYSAVAPVGLGGVRPPILLCRVGKGERRGDATPRLETLCAVCTYYTGMYGTLLQGLRMRLDEAVSL